MVDLALRAQAEGASPGQRWIVEKLAALLKRLGIPFWTTLVLLGAWAGAAHFGLVKPLFLPSPFDVALQFYSVAVDGFSNATLLQHVGASLMRIGVGFVAAAGVGVALRVAL